MHVIILAAGAGKRMKHLSDVPKSLLKIGDTTILARLFSQLDHAGFHDLSIVVGYRSELVTEEVRRSAGREVRIVENDRFRQDTNILSLTMALGDRTDPFLVIEADTIFDSRCFTVFQEHQHARRSIWYTRGYFQPHQVGGILKADKQGVISEIQIVPEYCETLAGHKKLANLLLVGQEQAPLFTALLHEACSQTIKQYYLIPWIDNIARLPCYEHDLGTDSVVAFNTPEEYHDAVMDIQARESQTI